MQTEILSKDGISNLNSEAFSNMNSIQKNVEVIKLSFVKF
jgi:hypothetical protein